MQCEKFEVLWNAALDERRAPEEDSTLMEHAAVCPGCAGLLSGAELLLQGLDARQEVSPPADFAAGVIAAMKRPPARFSKQTRLIAAFALAAAILVVVGLALLSPDPTSAPTPGTNPDFAQTNTAEQEQFLLDLETAEQLAPMLTSLPGLNDNYLAMLRETGTAVALFPEQLRRASKTDEPGVMSNRIRPVTQPFTAALDALRQTLPGSGSSLPDATPEDPKSSSLPGSSPADLAANRWA